MYNRASLKYVRIFEFFVLQYQRNSWEGVGYGDGFCNNSDFYFME